MTDRTRHIDDGVLRRLCDEPLALSGAEQMHLSRCSDCRERLDAMQSAVAETEMLFGKELPELDRVQALRSLHARLDTEAVTPRSAAVAGMRRRLRGRTAGFGGAATALALVGALTLTPAGSWAQSVLTVFQPQQVAPMAVASSDLQTLPKLRHFGTIHLGSRPQATTTSNLSDAQTAAGMQVAVPASLPSTVPSQVTYTEVPGTTASFTFSAAKAATWAAKTGKSIPPMPADINGSTLQLTTGNSVLSIYGPTHGIPTLVIGQTKAPVVTSTGVTIQQLESYVLSLPGVSPQLAADIRSIGNPTSTLPLPIPVNLAHGQAVTVQGVQGVAVGDNTGMGSLVVWEKGGIIYGVGGTLTQDQVMSIAESLH